jgi:hypothetical protein
MDLGLRMQVFQPGQVVLPAKIKLVDSVTHVERRGYALHLYLHVMVEIGVAGDVEVARYLFDGEGTH